jgi:lysophospholipase L1-like esterase
MKTRSFLMLSGFLLIMMLPSSCQDSQTRKFIPANDPDINIMGRTLETEEGFFEFDWPGVTIRAKFAGPLCAARMSDTKKNYYNVFIDKSPAKVIEIHSDTTVLLAENLGSGTHTLMITKRTEGNQGKATFKGLELSATGKMVPGSFEKERKIEFIGNSITCGYGVESNNKNDPFKAETENNYQSFAPITARAFNADYHVIAHSGQGVVRNYGYKEPVSPYTMPDRYTQVFDMEKEPAWDFTTWKPDIVIINLGTNDFSTEPHPNMTVFNKKYNSLIRFIRQQYDTIPIFCLVGPMIDEPAFSYVKNMVEGNRNFLHDSQVYFIGIPKYLIIEDEDLGASWHPNYSGQKKMANLIVPVISSVTGWDYGDIE